MERLLHRESRPENFRRAFELDPSIDTGKIIAKIDQGIATFTLPKAEQVKPRKIAVSISANQFRVKGEGRTPQRCATFCFVCHPELSFRNDSLFLLGEALPGDLVR